MIDIEKNIAAVRARIRQAVEEKSDRDTGAADIRLLAVSKKQPVSAILAASEVGIRHFGENYLQEATEKISQLREKGFIWHFIGAIQSNKTAEIARDFDWVHSIDRIKIAQRLNRQRPSELEPLNVCIQVNIDDEPTKSGVQATELAAIIHAINQLPRLKLRGLMAIPAARDSTLETRQSFSAMHDLFEDARVASAQPYFDTLSMGMSADLELAIAEGATLLRVGTDIFGPRGA